MAKGKNTGHKLTGRGPGRPKGALNKATLEIRAFSRSVIEDEGYVKAMKRRVKKGDAAHLETLFYHYAYGKPPDKVKFEGEQPFRIIFENPPEAEQ